MSTQPYKEFSVKDPAGKNHSFKFYYDEGMSDALVEWFVKYVKDKPKEFYGLKEKTSASFRFQATDKKFYTAKQGTYKGAFIITAGK
jgi:hypothetical protein